ncbi:MAG: glucose-6-phosphate isomerase [Spirochaetaceae bacterium]|jgi:glucose-6-phosphate isomerase|nr:glucose-6-phosphate isomerase [Spirochaetaceae bacterium]
MRFINLDKTASYKKLLKLAKKINKAGGSDALDAIRIRGSSTPIAAGLKYNWAAKKVSPDVLAALQELADEQELVAKYQALLDGDVVNTGEKRKVLHHLLRGQLGKPVIEKGKNLGEFYKNELERILAFAQAVHAGVHTGASGRKFTQVVQIGIGGSDLGPRALYLAMEGWATREGRHKMKAAFISNVDPDDGAAVIASVNLEETLFVLVSKSGTTQETLANELFVKACLNKAKLDPCKHLVAVTSETSPLANNKNYLDSFYIDDYIGGRYSATSAVGGVVLSLAFGGDTFKAILTGAHEADKAALVGNIHNNAALLDALIGVWERNCLGYPATAVLPYSQALIRFPAHLQQLDMESNGKQVNRAGKPVKYPTGPVIFGEPGTNGQHSFYQLLHQGSDIIPLQFIGFNTSQRDQDIDVDGSNSQAKLKANLAAQIVAFAKGKADANPNKTFKGGRPSSLIHGHRLVPGALGALLAHFENKVMFQGFIWNLNSFDQEGVQLGKVLTKQALSGNSGDDALDEYCKILEVSAASA